MILQMVTVERKPVELLSESVNVKQYKKGYVTKNVDRYGYYVPFLDQLASLLSLRQYEIRDVLATDRMSCMDDGIMKDVADGSYVQTHPFMISLYTDDFEIVNPIGSHRKKHKLTAFYWT
jgi:hypothetical protein